jgi:hypothetical protein
VSSARFLVIGLVLMSLGQSRVVRLAVLGVPVGNLIAALVISRLQ